MMPSSRKRTWEEKLGRSGFFVGALLFHLVIFLLIATYVIFPGKEPDQDTSFHSTPLPQTPPPTPPPPPVDPAVSHFTIDQNPSPVNPIIYRGPSPFHPPIIDLIIGNEGPAEHGPIIDSYHAKDHGSKGLDPARLKKVHEFELAHRPESGIENHDPAGTFPVYVASYADGDWYCNVQLDPNGNITAGSMPNLTAKIEEWTHGEVKMKVCPKPLSIGGPELMDTKPPFILFTGHKDFRLTDKEIENLRAYLEMGGAIWGDNALAGKGSRFDVAFKREMKRVVPDLDKNFEPLALDTDIFTKQKYPISQIPEGMNYYTEPLEHLDIDGIPAIIYTPNDYTDLYTMRILPGDKEIMGDHIPLHWTGLPLVTNGVFLHNENLFFRNFTLPSAIAVHKLGMNMITYLITRFDDLLLLDR